MLISLPTIDLEGVAPAGPAYALKDILFVLDQTLRRSIRMHHCIYRKTISKFLMLINSRHVYVFLSAVVSVDSAKSFKPV